VQTKEENDAKPKHGKKREHGKQTDSEGKRISRKEGHIPWLGFAESCGAAGERRRFHVCAAMATK
jgi:hypothetical protein